MTQKTVFEKQQLNRLIWAIIFLGALNVFALTQFSNIPQEKFNVSDYFLYNTLPKDIKKDIPVFYPFDKHVTWVEDYFMLVCGFLGGMRIYFIVRNAEKYYKQNCYAYFFELMDNV